MKRKHQPFEYDPKDGLEMTNVLAYFRDHTSVEPEWFLIQVLEVLGVIARDSIAFPPFVDSKTILLDENGNRVGLLEISEKELKITRL